MRSHKEARKVNVNKKRGLYHVYIFCIYINFSISFQNKIVLKL